MVNPEHEGWMSERVVTADWLEDIGEISFMSTWCEASLALTYTEVPGVYIDTTNNYVIAFDNIEASLHRKTEEKLEVLLKNPTNQTAHVKIFVEDKNSRDNSLSCLTACQTIDLKPGESRTVHFPRNNK